MFRVRVSDEDEGVQAHGRTLQCISAGGKRMALARGPEDGICAARECSRPATLQITWTNPKIPWSDSKTWLACENHREELSDYMRYRGFPFTVTPLGEQTKPTS